MPRRKSQFKQRKEYIDAMSAPVERDIFYWLEHIVHWHLALFSLIMVFTFAYLFLNNNSPISASSEPVVLEQTLNE